MLMTFYISIFVVILLLLLQFSLRLDLVILRTHLLFGELLYRDKL